MNSWYIAKLSEAAVIGISESKLDDSVLSSEIQIENYDLVRSDRNRQGGGVACFIRKDLSYNTKPFSPSEIENTFTKIFLPHSKPLVVGTVHRPPSQSNFTETITEHCPKINTNDTEIYILGDLNTNLFSKPKYIFHQTNTQSISPEVKNYFQICSLYGLEQLIKSPTRVTCRTSSFITIHWTTFPERVSQQGIIYVGLPDHQLIYCIRKFLGTKVGTHKQITFFSSQRIFGKRLNHLVYPKKISVFPTNAIEDNNRLKYDIKSVAQTFSKMLFWLSWIFT